jgi:hypothetical protein
MISYLHTALLRVKEHMHTFTQPTAWSRALLEKPPAPQPLKNFPTFYGIRRFITVLIRAYH